MPAQTTLRVQLKRLAAINAIDRHRHNGFPGRVDYGVAPAGRELLLVARVLERWLAERPGRALSPGSTAGRSAVKALIEGWSTTMLRAIAAEPLSLTALDRIIGTSSYPALERRLAAMRQVGLVEAVPSKGPGTPYGATEWLRRAVAPLCAAIRWERRFLADTSPPITGLDVETALLLVLPLLDLPAEFSGLCRIAVGDVDAGESRFAGVQVEVKAGRVVSASTRMRDTPDAWALGTPSAWLAATIDGERSGLEFGGESRLMSAMIEGLHRALVGANSSPGLDFSLLDRK